MVVEFSDGFETGDTTKWDGISQTSGILTVESLNPFAGSKHLRCVTTVGAAQKRAYVSKLFAETPIKHLRSYVYLHPSVIAAAERVTFICFYTVGAAPGFAATVTVLGGKLVVYFNDAVGTYRIADPNIVFPRGKYVCLELGVKMGAGDGEIHLWVDNVEVIKLLNLNNAAFGNINAARVGIVFGYATLQVQTVDTDEVAIGSTYIGPFRKAGCFIATAAYGSPLAPQLSTLRRFRDRCLPKPLVEGYYRTSPPIADYISRHQRIRLYIRQVIDLLIKVLKFNSSDRKG